VLCTLRTTDAAAAALRLVDIGVEPYLVASALTCVVAQRLARRLCRHCRVPVFVPGTDVGLQSPGEVEVYEARGCDECRDSGYHGRIGLFELMPVTQKIRIVIRARGTASEIRWAATGQGMRTLVDDGLTKVRAGETTRDEVARVTA